MSWLDITTTLPPPDMEMLLWNKHTGCQIGSVSYIGENIHFILLKDQTMVEKGLAGFTHWMQIPSPTPPLE
jgi:hypothetical protein